MLIPQTAVTNIKYSGLRSSQLNKKYTCILKANYIQSEKLNQNMIQNKKSISAESFFTSEKTYHVLDF